MFKETDRYFIDETDGHKVMCRDLITLNRNKKVNTEKEKEAAYEIRVYCSNCGCGKDDPMLSVWIPFGITAKDYLAKEGSLIKGKSNLSCPQCKCKQYLRRC